MHIFDNDNFSIITKSIFFDNDNLPISCKNADISAINNFFDYILDLGEFKKCEKLFQTQIVNLSVSQSLNCTRAKSTLC